MRVLCGWEFGAGLGHLTRLKRVAMALVGQGAEIVLASQEIDRARMFLSPDLGAALPSVSLIPAPRWTMPTDPNARKLPTHSFADVLHLIGYGSAPALAVRMEAWAGMLRTLKPDLVLCDFSPTLRLAARGRVPAVVIGNGYTIPPAGRPLPPIRPWQDALEPFSLEHEQRLLDTVNGVLGRRGDPPIDHFADCLSGDRTFVFSIPLVDPYAAHRDTAQLPPFNLPQGIRPLPAEARRARGLFFYMPRTHPELDRVIAAIRKSGVDCEAHIGDLPASQVQRLSGPRLRVHGEPQPFDRVMPEARGVVHHGGLSTAVAAVLAGTPQLILPWNLEHLVTARRIETLGAAAVASPGSEWPDKRLSETIARMVYEPRIMQAAQDAADKLEIGDAEAGLATVVAACMALAA